MDYWYDNNNEYTYREVVLCMLHLTDLFEVDSPILVKQSIDIARSFWENYYPGEYNPVDEINAQYKILKKEANGITLFDNKKLTKEVLQLLAVTMLCKPYDEKHKDDNFDTFEYFLACLNKLGCYKTEINQIIYSDLNWDIHYE